MFKPRVCSLPVAYLMFYIRITKQHICKHGLKRITKTQTLCLQTRVKATHTHNKHILQKRVTAHHETQNKTHNTCMFANTC